MEQVQLSIGVSPVSLDFEDFYRAEFPRVYRASWLFARDVDNALDATQEAFGRAYSRWTRLQKEEWAAGWVISTAVNVLKRRRRRAPQEQVDPPEVEASTSEIIDLRRALRDLPQRQRQAVVLFYVGDLSVYEVANLMGVSDGTVKAHLSQGREALRKRLETRHV
jgi:RNA polymerase sigma-70 factor, ECF subfamily